MTRSRLPRSENLHPRTALCLLLVGASLTGCPSPDPDTDDTDEPADTDDTDDTDVPSGAALWDEGRFDAGVFGP